MVMMESYYSPDRLQDIWHTIDQLHLSYLEMEESPEKLDHRIRLENCIREFLSMASHSQKFFLRETGDVLYRSASVKKDFSGYKAATGWNAIQMYAGNLLSQPWRKEYRQIKTYCGFYKHQIEANLVGAELMFEVMGYKHSGNGILVLEGPICPDRVTVVSRDCLIAYVECQILKSIWEEFPPAYKISWLEVLEFRRSHLCSPEQTIRALNYQYHEKQFQAQNSNLVNRCHQTNSFPPPTVHNHPLCVYNGPYPTYAQVPYPVHYSQPIKPNGYYCANGFVGHPMYNVPTGQLIELDHNGGGYDVVDYGTRNGNREKKMHPQPNPSPGNKDDKEENYGDWDYVYRNLESKGYTKDLGERGDILSSLSNQKSTKATNLDEAMTNLKVSDKPEVENRKPERRLSQASSYENLSEIKKVTKLKKIFEKNNNEAGASNSKKNKWECKACTYHNDNGKDICEMCSKSKSNVEQKMEVGGPQCSKCTLVNARDSKACQACGASLKDSPTYI